MGCLCPGHLYCRERILKAVLGVWKVCSHPCQSLVLWNTSSFSQPPALLAAETRLTECPLPELGSVLRGREGEADSTFQGFYSGLVLQVSCESQSHPPVEQPSVAAPEAYVVEGCLTPPLCPPDAL